VARPPSPPCSVVGCSRKSVARRLCTKHYVGEKRARIQQIKVERGCTDCGFNAHPAALDFDHRPGESKLFNVASNMNYSMERLLSEIAKCDVRCANCHRIKTVERRNASTSRRH
jgi:hypothetical protein